MRMVIILDIWYVQFCIVILIIRYQSSVILTIFILSIIQCVVFGPGVKWFDLFRRILVRDILLASRIISKPLFSRICIG